MPSDNEIFSTDDQAVWKERFRALAKWGLKHGQGPFTVIETKDVPMDKIASAGHSQWVTIDINGNPETFSGFFLKKVQ